MSGAPSQQRLHAPQCEEREKRDEVRDDQIHLFLLLMHESARVRKGCCGGRSIPSEHQRHNTPAGAGESQQSGPTRAPSSLFALLLPAPPIFLGPLCIMPCFYSTSSYASRVFGGAFRLSGADYEQGPSAVCTLCFVSILFQTPAVTAPTAVNVHCSR